jgi:predicted transcriptional regulator
MTIDTIRQKLHEFIDKIEEKKVQAIYTIFEEGIGKSENVTIEQNNRELDEAEAEFENGEFISQEEMLKQIKKW